MEKRGGSGGGGSGQRKKRLEAKKYLRTYKNSLAELRINIIIILNLYLVETFNVTTWLLVKRLKV